MRRPCSAAQEAYRDSVEVFRPFVADHPGVAVYHRELAEALLGSALTKGLEGDRDGQHQTLEESLGHARKAAKLGPSVEVHRRVLRAVLFQMADVNLRIGRHEEAFALACEFGEWASIGYDYLTAAALLSACAELAEQAPGLPPARRAGLVETYTGRAFAVLAAGLKGRRFFPEGLKEGSPWMADMAKQFPDLKPPFDRLRERPEFRKLLRE